MRGLAFPRHTQLPAPHRDAWLPAPPPPTCCQTSMCGQAAATTNPVRTLRPTRVTACPTLAPVFPTPHLDHLAPPPPPHAAGLTLPATIPATPSSGPSHSLPWFPVVGPFIQPTHHQHHRTTTFLKPAPALFKTSTGSWKDDLTPVLNQFHCSIRTTNSPAHTLRFRIHHFH